MSACRFEFYTYFKEMKLKRFPLSVLLTGSMLFAAVPYSGAEEQESRKITIVQDNANTRFVSKLFVLRYVDALELLPYLNSAILRYSRNSTIRRVVFAPGQKDGLLVTTGVRFMPYLEELVRQLDIPADGLAGTGLARVAYTPRYRAARQFPLIIDGFLATTEGLSGVDPSTNTIFFRDNSNAVINTLNWIKLLDRPLPQVRVRFNYYEVRESTLRDIGFDYLAWKNGPGVNLFNVGYNAGRLAVNEAIASAVSACSWGYGGFFFAPAFDMSFIRCLQQSGHSSLGAHAELTMVNTPIVSVKKYLQLLNYQKQHTADETLPYVYRIGMTPEYQNITKNGEGRSYIGASVETDDLLQPLEKNPPYLKMAIFNPVVCLSETENEKGKRSTGSVLFRYAMEFKNTVERGNTGQELSTAANATGGVTMAFGIEKILTVYEKDSDVEQTIGLPVLSKIPVLKYLFSTTTTIKEHTYIVVTAEAEMVTPDEEGSYSASETELIHDRKQKDFFED